MVKLPENYKSIHSLNSKETNIAFDALPETLIIVGEQRPN